MPAICLEDEFNKCSIFTYCIVEVQFTNNAWHCFNASAPAVPEVIMFSGSSVHFVTHLLRTTEI